MKLYAKRLLIARKIAYRVYLPIAVIISFFVDSAAFNLISATICALVILVCDFFKKRNPNDFRKD